jgi:cell wall-associated NlpC family hydrolase
MTDASHSAVDHDLTALQARALRQRQRQTRSTQNATALTTRMAGSVRWLCMLPQRLPRRYLQHLLVSLLIPLAILASQMPLAAPFVLVPPLSVPRATIIEPITPPAPLFIEQEGAGDRPVADTAFAEIDALSPSISAPELLEPRPLPATIAVESAKVRNGPGTNYDQIGDLPAGTPLQVVAQYQGWYQSSESDGRSIWVAAELLSLEASAVDLLPQASTIPAPPPAKIAQVVEGELNLRDGPGTSYVGMIKLDASTQVDLLARYNDWFQVQTPQGEVGWVLGEYLAVGPGVVERIEAVATVPEANPALIGLVQERTVNLRSGPGTAYSKREQLGTGMQLDLLGRYRDWYNVRTPNGTVGWVSSELVEVSEFIARRIPAASDIPALPRPKPVTQPAARSQIAQGPAPAPSAAAGSVVEFAIQLVGSRYVWGGAGPQGFDCSGFTRYVYAQYGLDLPHSSAGQYSSNYGTAISDPAELRPGDIVFFVNTYKRGISHVGLYIGGGDVVQAMSPKLGVGVANLNGDYWAQHYYGAIRPSR